MYSPCKWKQAGRNPTIWANDIVDINIKTMVELGMIGTMFLDCAVVFDTPFNLLVLWSYCRWWRWSRRVRVIFAKIGWGLIPIIIGGWTRGLAPVWIHHGIIVIINDHFVVVTTEQEDMSVEVVVVGVRILLGNFNYFFYFLFILFILFIFTGVWFFIFIFTTFMRFRTLMIAVTLIVSVTLWWESVIRDLFNVFLMCWENSDGWLGLSHTQCKPPFQIEGILQGEWTSFGHTWLIDHVVG